ncbi:hypothetical protein WJX84_005540 [Apatococcus fuscideae]|uniref:Non-ribosomal peptide synthetase n=1 Tax=Apatococcus fuscideae TaxID=2026836 RepID=A0AAW1SRP9_9CHLO
MEPQAFPHKEPDAKFDDALSQVSLDRNSALSRSGKSQGALARKRSGFDGSKLSYWKENLQGKVPELGLPADKSKRNSLRASGALQAPFPIPAELSSQLEKLAEQLRVDLHHMLLTAFSVLLLRYSRQDDITLGCAIPIGPSQVQLLPIRLDLAEDPGFEKVLGKACTALDRAKQHSGLQLEQLVEASGGHMPSGHIPSHPLYQAAFLMRLQGQPHANAVHEELERFMLDVLMEINTGGPELQGILYFNATLFNQNTIKRMASHFTVLLSSLARQPQARLSELMFIDNEERQLVLEGFNWTQQPLPPFCRAKTMDQILEHWAAEGPGRPCLIFEGQQLSYGEVDGRANQLAHHLIALGVTPGSSVGVMMERSFELFIGIFAVLKAGAAYIPMDPEYPADRLVIMAEDSEVLQ